LRCRGLDNEQRQRLLNDYRAARRRLLLLDYDGTLTPIVERPEDAHLPAATRRALEELAATIPVAILSGRDLDDVRAMVGIGSIAYAGSHGFDIVTATGDRHQWAKEYLPDLDDAGVDLAPLVDAIAGARVERKRFAIAVHYRQVAPPERPAVEAAVERVARAHPRLRRTGGKMVAELRPDVDWDKGSALRWLLQVLELDRPDVVAVYVGDDETDEDAFRQVRATGLGVVVRGEADDRPTLARRALADPDEVRTFLERLATVGGTR
jgi:trehalose-phosphatase